MSRLLAAAIILAMFPAIARAQALGSTASPDGKVVVDVLSLKRSEGETMTIRIQVTNNGADSYSMTIGNMRLLDIVGRRVYSVGVNSSSCSTAAGQKSMCFAMFAAPPPTTKTMTVQFYEKLDIIPGIPVSD